MKPLILLLLFALTAQAQTLADAARKERQRQAQVQSRRLITTEDARAAILPEPGQVVTSLPSVPVAPRPATPSAAVPPPGVPAVAAVDPARKYQEDLTKLRLKLRDLQDEETSLQLQITDLTNRFNAPVTDTTARADAQARLGVAQTRLTAVRGELDVTRRALTGMEAQAPPPAARQP